MNRTALRGGSGLAVLSAVFLGLGLLAGCPGDLDPSLADGGACDPTPVFAKAACALSGCHDATGTSGNFDMASPDLASRLLDVLPKGGGTVPSACSTLGKPYLVKGVVPASGLFIDKLTSNPPCGAAMPLARPHLRSQELRCVLQWASRMAVMSGAGGVTGEGGAGSGGAPGTGGSAGSGGTPGTGGRAGSGGAPGAGGRAGSGGAGSGGSGAGTGGAIGTGGSGTGGMPGSGGNGTGGAPGEGGAPGTGGDTGEGGAPGSGGAAPGNGGDDGGDGQ